VQEDKPILELKRSYWGLRSEMKEWSRAFIFCIPGKTGEFLRRRYALKHFKKCGNKMKMYPHGKIYNPQNLIVGDGVVISDFVQISAGGGVTLGNRVILGPFVKVWSINHRYERTDIPIWDQGWTTNPVIIEDDVWIGMGAIILPGTHIGKGALVSAGSVLRKQSIKPYSIVAGNPGRVVGQRIPGEKLHTERLNRSLPKPL